MTKPIFKKEDQLFTSQRSIKDKATLSEKDFQELFKAAAAFIWENEDDCRKVPRLWSKDNWKTLAIMFVETGAGEKFWHKEREAFTSTDDFVYPADKDK